MKENQFKWFWLKRVIKRINLVDFDSKELILNDFDSERIKKKLILNDSWFRKNQEIINLNDSDSKESSKESI